jgi:hypothetical protein
MDNEQDGQGVGTGGEAGDDSRAQQQTEDPAWADEGGSFRVPPPAKESVTRPRWAQAFEDAARSSPVKQPQRPIREATPRQAEKAAPELGATIQGNLEPSVQQASVQAPPPPLSPEERWKQQLEERARLRAEWRGQRR